jgi:hypothetical protein
MKITIACQLVGFSRNYMRVKSEDGYFFDVALKNSSVRIQLAMLRNLGVSSFEVQAELVSLSAWIEKFQVSIPMLVAKRIKAASDDVSFELA